LGFCLVNIIESTGGYFLMADETLNENTNQITLDGQPVTQERLEEARKKPNVKIVEVEKGKFKTLSRMQG
jgi:hypothetical protein